MTVKHVVLAYSGGLDTSAIIPWLRENYACQVTAFVANVGQGDDELAGIEEKALASGAAACHVVDLRQSLVEDYIFPVAAAGAFYESNYLLGTAVARPVIARAQAELALQLGADALAHGCTGKGNDQIRFESAFAALAPRLKVIAPWRIWQMKSRQQLLDYLAERQIPTTASADKIYSRDANLLHISHEGGELEDPWQPPSDKVWTWTCDPANAPDEGQTLTLTIDKGRPVSIDGQRMAPVALLEKLNAIGALHGIGRIDIVENRVVGMKSRGCYETPGGTILYAALQAIDSLVHDRNCWQLKQQWAQQLAQLVYDGQWFTPAREALMAATEKLASVASGEVVLRLCKGQITVLQRRSPFSLYAEQYATFDEDEVYNQQDAAGFIRLYSLASRIRASQWPGGAL